MRLQKTLMIAALISLTLGATAAAGRTWTVRKDGTGDFQVIQEAVDAASDGDVIDIGPGRFDDYQTIWYQGAPGWDAYVNIDGKSLTLQGAGADQTIIGPEDQDFHPWPGIDVMVIMALNCGPVQISDMTLEHSPWELISYSSWDQRLEVSRCVFREGNRGVIVACPDGGFVTDSQFFDMDDYAIHTTNPTNNFVVQNCSFSNVYGPAAADWSPSQLVVSDCTMDGGRVGVGFYGGASGSVTRCTMTNFTNYGVGLNNPGAVTITDNIIEQTDGWGMAFADANEAVITNNLIRTQTGGCLYLPYPSDGVVFEGNDLYRGSGDFAKTNEYFPYNPPTYFHLENNYWGTTDAEEIQAHMNDGHFQEFSNMFVLFEPFEGGPVPTQNSSWGSLKAMYRGE